MLSIPFDQSYKFEINANCAIQLAFEVEEKKYVQKIISNLSKKVIGLHLRLNKEGDRIFYHKNEPPIIKIPNSKNLETAIVNYGIHNKINPYISLGSIGFNDNMVILNISHSVSDGGYFKYLAENIFNDNNVKIPSYFPYKTKDLFKEQYAKSPNNIPFWENNPNVNNIITNDKTKLFTTNEVDYSTVCIPSNKLLCYNQNDKKLHSFTNSLWSSLFVSSIVHNHSTIPKIVCIPTCTDFRRYLKEINYSICSCYSTVFPCVSVKPNDSLQTIGESMKNDLNRRMNNYEDFGFLKTIDEISDQVNENENENNISSTKKVGLELTYVGAININQPIKNIFMNLNMNAKDTESILSLMGFSCVEKPCKTNPDGKNEVTLRLRYSPTTLHKVEVARMMKNIEFILTKIPTETSLKEAINAVADFQSKS